jgi:hypothetical protein
MKGEVRDRRLPLCQGRLQTEKILEVPLCVRKVIAIVRLGASADHALMNQIATIGGGTHYEITGSVAEYTQELREVFKELGEGFGTRSTLVR